MIRSHLTNRARAIRRRVLSMANLSRSAHVGSSLSCVDLLTYLYFEELDIRPTEPTGDRFLLSKGHAAMALYATLAQRGILDPEILDGYMVDGGSLPAHLDRFACRGVEISAGALGHGLPIGLGMAHGLQLRGLAARVFVLMGDGECQEGAIWEAAMLAPRLGLSNLTAIIDYNNLQGYGRPTEIVAFEPVVAKWQAFGWHVVEVDGHDFISIAKGLAATDPDRPRVVVAHTVKGKGVSFMEDQLKWHYHIVSDELLERACEELEDA